MKVLTILSLLLAAVGSIIYWNWDEETGRLTLIPLPPQVGDVLDSHQGVDIHYNGRHFAKSHGSRYSEDGYYYGKTWQCVEYAKRFYFDALGHRMPEVWGHARDFFIPALPHNTLNADRGLLQFDNGGNSPPQVDDLVVFRGGPYGHVAIVSMVGDGFVEMVQQNVGTTARGRWTLERDGDSHWIRAKNPPAGWLRLP